MIPVRYLSAKLAESLKSSSGTPTGPVALSDLIILFISSLEAGGKFSNTGMISVRFLR